LFPDAGAVVHTVGTLIEDGKYKEAMKNNDIPKLVASFFDALLGAGNPLEKGSDVQGGKRSYEVMNRDAGRFRFMSMNNR
jgi:hypothetical protein